MFNVRLAGGHLYGKQLYTWLSLVVSLMASFVVSFFPLGVLGGIWDLIESVSEGFLTYSLYSFYESAQPNTLDHGVSGSYPASDEIRSEPRWRFTKWRPSSLPFSLSGKNDILLKKT